MARPFVRWSWVAALALTCGTTSGSAFAQGWSYTRIADTGTIMPGSTMPFLLFEFPSIHNGLVGFAGFGGTTTGPAGVYTGSGGALTVIADKTTPIPGGTGNFTGFGLGAGVWPSLHAGTVAFLAGNAIEGGIYNKSGGVITPVATTATPIPNGGGLTFGGTRNPSLENGRVVFAAVHHPLVRSAACTPGRAARSR